MPLFVWENSVPPSTLYLFQCGDTDRYALSRDKTGANLPMDGHPWLLRSDVNSADLNDDVAPAIQAIDRVGYCIIEYPIMDVIGT